MYEPDNFEKGVRFGCGATLGVVCALVFLLNHFWHTVVDGAHLFAAVIGFALIFGYLAVRYGDRFWEGFMDYLRNCFPWI